MTIPSDETLRRMIRNTPREVEAMVAERICGWRGLKLDGVDHVGKPLNKMLNQFVPSYLDDANASLKVVEAMMVRFALWALIQTPDEAGDFFAVDFYRPLDRTANIVGGASAIAFGETIILAAFAAIREGEQQERP